MPSPTATQRFQRGKRLRSSSRNCINCSVSQAFCLISVIIAASHGRPDNACRPSVISFLSSKTTMAVVVACLEAYFCLGLWLKCNSAITCTLCTLLTAAQGKKQMHMKQCVS